MAALKEAQQQLDKLKAAVKKGDLSGGKAALTQLKLRLIQLPAVPPNCQPSATAQQELLLARDAYEQAVLLALKGQGEQAMEAAFTQLKAFYADTRTVLPPAPQEHAFAGLNLLRLLVASRIAEFHTELELVPEVGMACEHVRAAVQLEQWLMEGSYNKVLAAGSKLPAECAFAVEQLTTTVRDEIASGSEAAYERLRLADAQKLLMLKGGAKEAEAYAKQRGWAVEGGVITFGKAGAAAATANGAGAAAAANGGSNAAEAHMRLISHALAYAKELERIV